MAETKINPELSKQRQERFEELKRSINTIAKTEEGKLFFEWLRIYCGFDTLSVNIDSIAQGSNSETFLYNEGKKTIYIAIRNLLDSGVRQEIESVLPGKKQ